MPVVPSSFDALLFLFVGAFSAPTFETFRMLVVGFICRVGEHSVCGMLQGARLERSWHHSRGHALFAERKWCPDELGLLLLAFLVATFVPGDQSIRFAVDDSLFSRTGKQVHGAAWQYDGSAPSGQGPKIGYGNNWVILTLIVRLPFMNRAVSLPVLQRLWQPDPQAKAGKKNGGRARRKPNPDYPSKSSLAREMLDLVAALFPDRRIELVGDSAYATKTLGGGLEERVMLTSRLKSNAALYAPRPPRTGKRGQPAKKGKRLPQLKAIADDPATVWEQTEVVRSGKRQTVAAHSNVGALNAPTNRNRSASNEDGTTGIGDDLPHRTQNTPWVRGSRRCPLPSPPHNAAIDINAQSPAKPPKSPKLEIPWRAMFKSSGLTTPP